MLQVIKERDQILNYSKVLVAACVKNNYADPATLNTFISEITPAMMINGEDIVKSPNNPILPFLTDALYHELKRVKEAAELQRELEHKTKE